MGETEARSNIKTSWTQIVQASEGNWLRVQWHAAEELQLSFPELGPTLWSFLEVIRAAEDPEHRQSQGVVVIPWEVRGPHSHLTGKVLSALFRLSVTWSWGTSRDQLPTSPSYSGKLIHSYSAPKEHHGWAQVLVNGDFYEWLMKFGPEPFVPQEDARSEP